VTLFLKGEVELVAHYPSDGSLHWLVDDDVNMLTLVVQELAKYVAPESDHNIEQNLNAGEPVYLLQTVCIMRQRYRVQIRGGYQYKPAVFIHILGAKWNDDHMIKERLISEALENILVKH